MRRFPVRGMCVIGLALALSLLPVTVAQAAPWALPVDGAAWWAKVEQLVLRGWMGFAASERPAAEPAEGPAELRRKEGAAADPNGNT